MLPFSSADTTVLNQVGAQFISMLQSLDGLVPESSFVQHLVLSPRLIWEWAAGIILSSLILALLNNVYLILRYRVNLGPWLKVGGMMFVANMAERMKSAAGSSAGVTTQKGGKARYCVRDVGNRRMEVTGEPGKGKLLDKTQSYGEPQ
ncbi:hypothetical protein MMC29_003053 [Sticta canariensis]|nr:hypothetical protein [Sticta canariensis]